MINSDRVLSYALCHLAPTGLPTSQGSFTTYSTAAAYSVNSQLERCINRAHSPGRRLKCKLLNQGEFPVYEPNAAAAAGRRSGVKIFHSAKRKAKISRLAAAAAFEKDSREPLANIYTCRKMEIVSLLSPRANRE